MPVQLASKPDSLPVMTKVYRVLFLCTGNSSRSIMSEALLTALGRGRFAAYSAGSRPTGTVHPLAIEQIRRFDPAFQTAALRSKAWAEFALPSAQHMDFIITVCDSAAGEICPHWPGQPTTAHWGYPDPIQAGGERAMQEAFPYVFMQIRKRVEEFVALPLDWLEDDAVRREAVRAIAKRTS